MTIAEIRARVSAEARVLSIPVELRALSGDDAPAGTIAHVTGYAAVFDTLSSDLGGFRERLARGAFRKALSRSGPVHLVQQHDRRMLLSATDAGTLTLAEDPKGLPVSAYIVGTTVGRDAVMLIESGHLREMSFMFTVAEGGDTWEQAADGSLIRTVTEVGELLDVSIVRGPAYPGTSIGLRAALPDELAAVRAFTKSGVMLTPIGDTETTTAQEPATAAAETVEEVAASDTPPIVGGSEERNAAAARRWDQLRRQQFAVHASSNN